MVSNDLQGLLEALSLSQKRAKLSVEEYVKPSELHTKEKEEILEWIRRVVDLSLHAPSHGNFQPTRVIIVSHAQTKELLFKASFQDRSILDSLCTVVILSDRSFVKRRARDIIEDDYAKSAISEKEAKALRLLLDMGFSSAPFGLGAFFKKILIPFLSSFVKVPEIPIVNYRSWLYKQAGIIAGALLQSVHLHPKLRAKVCEWFDEKRALKALGMSPSDFYVPFIIPVGIARKSFKNERTTLEFDELISYG